MWFNHLDVDRVGDRFRPEEHEFLVRDDCACIGHEGTYGSFYPSVGFMVVWWRYLMASASQTEGFLGALSCEFASTISIEEFDIHAVLGSYHTDEILNESRNIGLFLSKIDP